MAQVGSVGRGVAGRLGMRSGRGVVIALVAVLACAGVALAVVVGRPGGVVVERADGAQPGPAATVASTTGASAGATHAEDAKTVVRVTVHVDGAVASPGVFDIASKSPRVNDAIMAAGGLVEGADTSGLNLAAGISDGDKVHVPREGEAAADEVASSGSDGSATAPPSSGAQASGASALVNINKASVEELDSLPGVGQSTAQAIVEDRGANGPFASVEDLMRVSGIGEKKFEKLKGRICV